MPYDFSTIRVDVEGHVAEVVFDRPDKLNAMSIRFFHEIREAFDSIDQDDEIRAVVVWGEGRLFTSGLDLKEAAAPVAGTGNGAKASEALRNRDLYRLILDLQDCFTAIARCRKPVIAAVHGKCIGGGVDLITACDIRMASADASFSVYETRIAMVADVGTLQRITPIVGKGVAREMALSGRFLGSDRALACGLVNHILEDKAALLAEARELAHDIASNSPLAVQGTKQVLNYSDEHSTAEGLEYVAQWNSSFLRSNDLTEALTAFIEKREPDYSGS